MTVKRFMPLSSVRLGYFVCQEESQSDLIVGLDILADCVIKPSNVLVTIQVKLY